MASRWLSSRWLELLLSLLAAATEAAALAVVLRFLAAVAGVAPGAVPSPVGLAIVGLVSFWAARYFLDDAWDLAAARGVSLALWLVMTIVWFGIKSGTGLTTPWDFVSRIAGGQDVPILLLLVGGVAWWHGISLAGDPNPFTPEFARTVVARGVIVVGVALVFAAMAGGTTAEQVNGSATAALPILLIAGLLLAGAAQVKASGRAGRSGLGWLGGAGGVALAIFVVAALVAGLAGRRAWSAILAPLAVLAHAIDTVLRWIVLGIAYVIYFVIVYPLLWLLRQLQGTPPQQPQQPTQQPNNLPQQLQQGHALLPSWASHLMEAALILVIAAIVLRLVLRSLRRYRGSGDDQPLDEVHESLWSAELAMAQLRDLFGSLRPHRAQHAHGPSLDLSGEPADVREAYRRLELVGERQGLGRRPAESASDYSARLRGSWVELQDPLDDLTGRYLRARYAEQSDEADRQAARRDWRAIAARILSRGGERNEPDGRR